MPSHTRSPDVRNRLPQRQTRAHDLVAAERGSQQPVGADVLRLRHRGQHGTDSVGFGKGHVLRPHAELRCAGRRTRRHASRQKIHARRADEVADESVARALEQLRCGADLHRAAACHHDDLLRERQRLDLVVRDVDQRQLQLGVNLLQLAPQLPLQVRVDDGQRLIEQHRTHVFAHQAAAERDLLFGIGRQASGALVQLAGEFQHLGDLADALLDLVTRHTPVLQRKGQVLRHRHRVVDDRELEHLRDVALLRRLLRDIAGRRR